MEATLLLAIPHVGLRYHTHTAGLDANPENFGAKSPAVKIHLLSIPFYPQTSQSLFRCTFAFLHQSISNHPWFTPDETGTDMY